MEAVLPLAGFGFALGWPLEWVIQRFPQGVGTAPSSRRRWIVAGITALLLTALVVPAAAIDLEHRIIPDMINLPGAVAVYVVSVAVQPDRWLELLLGGLGCFLFFFVAHMVSPKGMGMGDVKMALMIGLGLGQHAFFALFAAFLASTVLSMFLLTTRGRKGLKTYVPFGPFLAFGAVVALIWGGDISPILIGG